MEFLIPILIIIILIIINGLFVASEFGIVGAPKASLEAEAQKGSRWATQVIGVIKNAKRQDEYIATAQLGITLASLGLGMYGEHVLAGWIGEAIEHYSPYPMIAAHSIASVISIGFLTYLHIVFGEMIPKSIALGQPLATAKAVTPVIVAIQYSIFPLVRGLNWIGYFVLRLIGIKRTTGFESYRTPEELAYIVRESEAGGFLRSEAASVFQELLEFGDLTAAEAMVPRTMMIGISSEASNEEICQILLETPHSRYPIYVETLDQIIGLVHVKNLLGCLPDCRTEINSIIRSVPFVPHSTKLEAVLKTMNQAYSQVAIVMDEQGGTAGMITVEDLFEEVIGEIQEDPKSKPEIYKDKKGAFRASGTARLEDVGEEIGINLEHEEVDTVSGLVLTLLGRPAQIGDLVDYQGVKFKVIKIKGHGVRQCKLLVPKKV